jgi:hypothetical protein
MLKSVHFRRHYLMCCVQRLSTHVNIQLSKNGVDCDESATAPTRPPVSKRAFRFRKKVGQLIDQLRRRALVEEQFHPWETLLLAPSSAA